MVVSETPPSWSFDSSGAVGKAEYIRLVMRHFGPVQENDACDTKARYPCTELYEAFKGQEGVTHIEPVARSDHPDLPGLEEFLRRCPQARPFDFEGRFVPGSSQGGYALFSIRGDASLGELLVFYSEYTQALRGPRTGNEYRAGNGLYTVYGVESCERQTIEPVMAGPRLILENPSYNHGFFLYRGTLHFFDFTVLQVAEFRHLGMNGWVINFDIREFNRRFSRFLRREVISGSPVGRYLYRPGT